jgi:hypothetical protein
MCRFCTDSDAAGVVAVVLHVMETSRERVLRHISDGQLLRRNCQLPNKVYDLLLVDSRSTFADAAVLIVDGLSRLVITAYVFALVALEEILNLSIRTIAVFRARKRGISGAVEKIVLKNPPGHTLLRLCEYLFSPKTVNLTFRPLVADWRIEYFDALQVGRTWLARFVCLRYYWQFAKACGLSKVGRLFKAVARP